MQDLDIPATKARLRVDYDSSIRFEGVTFGEACDDRMGPLAASPDRPTVDTDADLPPCSMRQVDRRVRTAGQSIDRTANGTDRLAPASSTEHRSIARPATSTRPQIRPTSPASRQEGTSGTHAFAHLPLVPGGTIRLDSAHAAPEPGHQALLPNERLCLDPRAPSRGRHRIVPDLRLLQADRLTA